VGVLTTSAARASFPSQEWIKGMESTGKLTFPLHPSLLNFVSFSPVLYLLLNLRPSPMVMASDLPPSRYQTACDLRKPRKVIGWQSPGYDSKMRHGIVSLANMQPGDFVFLSSYALSGLVPPLSMLLEHYGLQLQLLSPHYTLVVIFIHFCEMFMGVRPSVRLFCRFHVLHAVSRHPSRIDGYYFQHRTKGPSKCIPALSSDTWEH
jgi:hypothetical protein